MVLFSNNSDSLWVRVIKAWYGLLGGFDRNHGRSGRRGVWTGILGVISLLHDRKIT